MVARAWAAHFADVTDLETPLTSVQVSVSDRVIFNTNLAIYYRVA
jgi:hypothetical protein